MKIRPLPEIDLARVAVSPDDQALKILRQLKFGWTPYTYHPVRNMQLDILNIEAGYLGQCDRASLLTIEAEIARTSKSEIELAANLEVARALYAFANAEKISGRRYEFFPLSVGLSTKVAYWSKAIFSLRSQSSVLFIDPRLTRNINADARNFVFSMMHERIRAADQDFAAVRLGIVQFRKIDKSGQRKVRMSFDKPSDLIAFDELDAMVRRSYRMWYKVLLERDEDDRRRSGGQGNLFRS